MIRCSDGRELVGCDDRIDRTRLDMLHRITNLNRLLVAMAFNFRKVIASKVWELFLVCVPRIALGFGLLDNIRKFAQTDHFGV
jgi:hypothetical protein